jgi:hypothetical protein
VNERIHFSFFIAHFLFVIEGIQSRRGLRVRNPAPNWLRSMRNKKLEMRNEK